MLLHLDFVVSNGSGLMQAILQVEPMQCGCRKVGLALAVVPTFQQKQNHLGFEVNVVDLCRDRCSPSWKSTF